MQTKLLLKKNWMLNTLMLVVMFAFGGVATVHAEGSGTIEDPWIFENGQTYHVDFCKSFYGIFTAPSDGTFQLTKTNYAVYTDATFATIDESIYPLFNGDAQNKAYSFECEAGKTYYIGNSFLMETVDMTMKFLTEAEAIELSDLDPADGSLFNAGEGIISFKFNQNVNIGPVELKAGQGVEVISANVSGAYANIDIKDLLNQFYNDGRLKEGDDIKLTLNNVAPKADLTKLYNGTGIIEITYKAGKQPLQIVSSTNTPDGTPAMKQFRSYYMADDNSGIISLTFSGDVNMEEGMRPTVTLSYGNLEAEDPNEYYSETITPTALMSNMLMINLKNKLRRAKDMVATGTDYKNITLAVNGVRDMDGNYAYGSGSGNLGSFYYVYELKEVAYNPMAEWSVDGGNNINVITNESKNIELWMSEPEGEKLSFSGVEFRYTEGGQQKTKVLKLGELTVTSEEANETIYTIPMPNISADAGTEITVSLTDIERPDGITPEISADAFSIFTNTFTTTGLTASEFTVESFLWHNGEEDVNMIEGNIGVLTKGTTSTLKTNKDAEIGYADFEIRGTEDPANEFIRFGILNGPQEDGYTIEWYGEALIDGKDYTFTLKAWRSESEKQSGAEPTIGQTTFIIHGAKKAYVYSDVVMTTDITKDFVLTSEEDNSRTIEFSAPVTMTAVVNTGSGTSMDCTVTPSEDRMRWTITVPTFVLSNFEQFNVNVFAKDDEGRALNKTQNGGGEILGKEDGTWFQLNFVSEYNKPEVTVTPADMSILESISTITFTYKEDDAIGANWNNYEKIRIYNLNTRELVAEFTEDDVVYIENPANPFGSYIGATITLAEPITTPGVYTVNVPADFFNLGEQFDGSSNKAVVVTYEIKAPAKPIDVVLTPAPGNVSEIPAKIIVTLPNNSSVGDNGVAPTLVDETGNSYAARLEIDWDIPDLNVITIVLADGAITRHGTYTLTIPTGALALDDDPDKTNETDLVFVYVVGTDGINNLVSAEGGKVNVYTVGGTQLLKNADAEAVGKLAKGMYIINGKKVIIR